MCLGEWHHPKAIFNNERYDNVGPKYLCCIGIYPYVLRDTGYLWVESTCLPFENAQSWQVLKNEQLNQPIAHRLIDTQ